MEDCCQKRKLGGFWSGVWLGILPHSFCLAFIIFTLIGSTIAAAFFRKFLLTPYFFEILVGLSFIFATISAAVYLKRLNILSFEGIRKKRGYLSILYGTTIAVNLLFFFVVFPAVANIGSAGGKKILAQTGGAQTVALEVKVPCSGHAPLIIDELKKEEGVINVSFSLPNIFEVSFDPQKTNLGKIMQTEIFKSYPALVK